MKIMNVPQIKGQNDKKEILRSIDASEASVITNTLLHPTTIYDVLEKIRTGEGVAEQISELRQISDQESRQAFKKNHLPYFVAGKFNGSRKNSSLISTELMIIDFDHLLDAVPYKKQFLQNDPSVFAIFLSPSGDGLKVLYRFNKPITSHEHYKRVYKHYFDKFGFSSEAETDKGTCDVSRACYFSYDPDIYVNIDAEPLDVDVESATAGFNFPEIRKSLNDPKYVPSAIDFLHNHDLPYPEWTQCGFAFASLGEAGRQFWIDLSKNDFHNDSEDYLNQKFNDFLTSGSGSVTLASLFQIAKNHGYEYPIISKTESDDSFADQLRKQFDFDDNRDPNNLLGFPLTIFAQLAGYTDGIQPGFYHLAAETNVGKTAVLTSLTLDLLETNPDVSVLYFSLDDSKLYTIYRFLSILTKAEINRVRKPKKLSQIENISLEKNREYILNLIDSRRLRLLDLSDVTHIDDVERELKGRTDLDKFVVFIDGLYNLSVSTDARGIREENIERAQRIKALVDTFHVPVISTGELRKKTVEIKKDKHPTIHDLMETGKFAYNANVVWLLYADKADDLQSSKPVLQLEFAKNKLSDYKGIVEIEFDRSKGVVTEYSPLHFGIPGNTTATSSIAFDEDEF